VVPRTPPEPSIPPRRHRSVQRDRILGWLRATDVHPTAAQIHEGLSPVRKKPRAVGASGPQVSLGTVYRNLEVLVAEGDVREVLVAGRPARYDARIDPHHHFCCDACGQIVDVDLPVPRSFVRRLAVDHGLAARRIHVSFHGLCPGCGPGEPKQESRASSR
jgi:Fur family ferric uptake transcriptional regulator